ncbi:MAG: hypothetical protein ACREJO_14965, partial [Phycisphaerales bacterium]
MLRLTVLACFLVASTTAATTCAAPPVILGDAITVQASSASGTASLVIPVASLTVLGDTADFRFPQPPASHILLIADGGTAEIAILSGLNVEFTGESSIRLGFDAYAGSSATQFTITSGKLSRTQTPAAFAGANASVVFHDVNLNGGSFNGSYVFPSPPIMVEYAYGAFYNDNSPLAPSVGFLLAPLYLNFNHVALGEGRFPASGDLVPFDQPVNQFHAAFSFTLSAFDSARANSLYTITPS